MTQGIGEGPRTVVLISGGGTNLQAFIDQVSQNRLGINLASVVSDRPDAPGVERAKRAGIPVTTVDYEALGDRQSAEQLLCDELERLQPKIVLLAGFMRILPTEIVTRHAGSMLNVHPSLLPKYRGLNTYRRVLEAGDAWHGSTVHFVTPELDAGPAILQYRVAVRADDTAASLADRVRQGEYIIFPRAVNWLATNRLTLVGDQIELDGQPLDRPRIVDEGGD
jgi:phosphoribosylglycinamide formyltransferase-1